MKRRAGDYFFLLLGVVVAAGASLAIAERNLPTIVAAREAAFEAELEDLLSCSAFFESDVEDFFGCTLDVIDAQRNCPTQVLEAIVREEEASLLGAEASSIVLHGPIQAALNSLRAFACGFKGYAGGASPFLLLKQRVRAFRGRVRSSDDSPHDYLREISAAKPELAELARQLALARTDLSTLCSLANDD